jgi:DNA helicase II / ATP-dependent DNA helicase PcrA
VLAAKRLIRHNRIRFDKDYQPALAEPGELVIRGYSSPEEARQVGRAIADLIRRGCAARDISGITVPMCALWCPSE